MRRVTVFSLTGLDLDALFLVVEGTTLCYVIQIVRLGPFLLLFLGGVCRMRDDFCREFSS